MRVHSAHVQRFAPRTERLIELELPFSVPLCRQCLKLVPVLAHLKVLHEERHSRLTSGPERLILVDHFGQQHDSFRVLFALLTHPFFDDVLDLLAEIKFFG